MKTLLLLRHAKSSWKQLEGRADHERPLNRRGRATAPRMGALLTRLQLCPELVIASSARRVVQTLDLLLPLAGFTGELLYTRSLYLNGASAYRAQLARVGACLLLPGAPTADAAAGRSEVEQPAPEQAEAETLMLVGHNPDLEELLSELTGVDARLPTGSLAVLRCNVGTWRAFGGSNIDRVRQEIATELVQIYRPRELST